MAEFALNNQESETTKCTPFLANSGQHPRMGFEPVDKDAPRKDLDAEGFVQKMQHITETLQEHMLLAQARQEEQANRRRQPAPRYEVGDLVWLDSKNIRTLRPCKKLDWKHLGPFKISKVVSPQAYELELPSSMRIHNVFHTSLLRPAASNPMEGQVIPARPPIVAEDGETEWYAEKILDSRRRRRKVQYLVQWEGGETTWEPEENITHMTEGLQEFHEKYPDKPRGAVAGATA